MQNTTQMLIYCEIIREKYVHLVAKYCCKLWGIEDFINFRNKNGLINQNPHLTYRLHSVPDHFLLSLCFYTETRQQMYSLSLDLG